MDTVTYPAPWTIEPTPEQVLAPQELVQLKLFKVAYACGFTLPEMRGLVCLKWLREQGRLDS